MDVSRKIIIKAELADDIRRIPIHNAEITYDELQLMMQRVFKDAISAKDELLIKYKDESGDFVTIADESDLLYAIQDHNILHIKIFVQGREKHKNTAKSPLCDAAETTSGDVSINHSKTVSELQLLLDRFTKLLERFESSDLVKSVRNYEMVGDVQTKTISYAERDTPTGSLNQPFLNSTGIPPFDGKDRTSEGLVLNDFPNQPNNSPRVNQKAIPLSEKQEPFSVNSAPPWNERQSTDFIQTALPNASGGVPPPSMVPPCSRPISMTVSGGANSASGLANLGPYGGNCPASASFPHHGSTASVTPVMSVPPPSAGAELQQQQQQQQHPSGQQHPPPPPPQQQQQSQSMGSVGQTVGRYQPHVGSTMSQSMVPPSQYAGAAGAWQGQSAFSQGQSAGRYPPPPPACGVYRQQLPAAAGAGPALRSQVGMGQRHPAWSNQYAHEVSPAHPGYQPPPPG